MKRIICPAILLAGLALIGCQEEPPEPEVSSTQATYDQGSPSQAPPSSATPQSGMPDAATSTATQMTIDDVQRISIDEYRQLAEAGQAVLIDVRNPPYYMQGHIPGAINIPATQTVSMINMLPKGKKVVTYCT